MLNKKKGQTTAPPPSNKAKMSDHLVRLSKDQALNEKCQIQVVESYLQMRAKTYAETFFPYFRMATFMKFLSHPLSFILSFPVAFTFLWVFAFGMEKNTILNVASAVYQDADVLTFLVFTAALVIVSAVLFAFEWAQHVALSTSYKMYYQTKKIEWPLVLVGVAFSILSIFLSAYGAQEIAEGGAQLTPLQTQQIATLDASIADAQRSRKATNTKDAELLKMKDRELSALRAEKYQIQSEAKSKIKSSSSKLLGFALTNEGCIHFATFFIFFYMFRSSKEFSFINDLFRGRDYLGLNFLSVGIPTIPNNLNGQSTDTNHQENDEPHRAPNNQNFNVAVKMPKKEQEQAQSLVRTRSPLKKVSSKLQGKKAKDTRKNFTKAELKRYLRNYRNKVRDSATAKAKKDNTKRVGYIQYVLLNFDENQTDGFVKFSIKDAAKWHKDNKANLA